MAQNTGDNQDKTPAWGKAANADIESAAREEEEQYQSLNFKKLPPRVIIGALVFFLLYTLGMYYYIKLM